MCVCDVGCVWGVCGVCVCVGHVCVWGMCVCDVGCVCVYMLRAESSAWPHMTRRREKRREERLKKHRKGGGGGGERVKNTGVSMTRLWPANPVCCICILTGISATRVTTGPHGAR